MTDDEKVMYASIAEELRLLRGEIRKHRELLETLAKNTKTQGTMSFSSWLVPVLLITGVAIGLLLLFFYPR